MISAKEGSPVRYKSLNNDLHKYAYPASQQYNVSGLVAGKNNPQDW